MSPNKKPVIARNGKSDHVLELSPAMPSKKKHRKARESKGMQGRIRKCQELPKRKCQRTHREAKQE